MKLLLVSLSESSESSECFSVSLYDMSLQEIYQNLDGGFNYNSFLKYNDNSYCPSRAYGLASSDSNTEMKETMNILKKKYFQPGKNYKSKNIHLIYFCLQR